MKAGWRGRTAPVLLGALLTGALAGCLGGVDDAALESSGAPPAASTFSDTAVFPGVYDTTGPYSRPLTEGIYDINEPDVVELASDVDGVTIQMGIVRPDVPAGTRVPVIAIASPFFDPMTPERIRGNPHRDQITWFSMDHYGYYVGGFVPHGYAVAFVATRGSGGSGGCHAAFGPSLAADVDQAVTWLGAQDWSNGNVGMAGISYEGTTPWMVAAKGNPHLRTIVPVVGLTDLHSWFVRNGSASLSTAMPVGTYPYGFAVEAYSLLTPIEAPTSDPLGKRDVRQRAEGTVCPEAARLFAAIATTVATASREPSDVWAAHDWRPGTLADYRGSVLLVHGLRDMNVAPTHVYPFVNELEHQGLVVKHFLGQWGHTYPDYQNFPAQGPHPGPRWDFAEVLLRWFDRWLKEDASVDVGPAAQVQDSSGRWRSESTWPPRDASPRVLHPAADGSLAREAPDPGGAARLCPTTPLVSLPSVEAALAPACPTELRFETAPFDEEFRFAGLPTFHATLTPSGPGGGLAAFLLVVDADGETRVGRGQIDLRVADGGDRARPIAPGAPLVARLQMEPLDVVVPAGARLALVLTQGAMDGRLAALPNFPVEVTLGGDASVLTVHAFEREPTDPWFFEPPGVNS